MKVIYERNEIAEVPALLAIGDTLIIDDKVYLISTKTFDVDNSELYCKVVEYEGDITSACDLLEAIYESPSFTTSGPNTNNVQNNPRLIVLMAIVTCIIKTSHMKRMGKIYRANAVLKWNSTHVPWQEIFNDDPPVATDDINKIIAGSKALLTEAKISQEVWPNSLRK